MYISSAWDDSFADHDDDVALEENYDNLLPQTVVTQVGEHLLSLVNEIETFSSSDAIYDLIPLYGTAAELSSIMKCWRDLLPNSDTKEVYLLLHPFFNFLESICVYSCIFFFQSSKCPTDSLCFRKSCRNILLSWQKNAAVVDFKKSEFLEETQEDDRSLQFVNEWLTAVSDYVVGLFLVQVMKMESLSTKGCFQLGADISYLINVADALGILPHPLLLHFNSIFSQGKGVATLVLKQSQKTFPGNKVLFFSCVRN